MSSLQWVQPPANNNTPRRDECETVSAAIYQRSIKTLYLQAFMRSSSTSKAIAFEDRRAKRQRLLDEKEITNTNTYKGLMALLHGCSGSWQLSNHTISKITPGRVIVSFLPLTRSTKVSTARSRGRDLRQSAWVVDATKIKNRHSLSSITS